LRDLRNFGQRRLDDIGQVRCVELGQQAVDVALGEARGREVSTLGAEVH